MNQAFKEALEKKKIFHFSKARGLVDKELKVAFDGEPARRQTKTP